MSNPNNLMNQNLAIGGNLETGGSVQADGGIATGGLPVPSGPFAGAIYAPAVFAQLLTGIITASGATFGFYVVEQIVTLSTSGAATTVTVTGLPAGSAIYGAALRVTTAISGANSTTITLNANPTAGAVALVAISSGGPPPPVDSTAFSLGAAGPVPVVDANDLRVVLSGGLDNTPSAGAVRITLFVLNGSAPTS